MVDIVIVGTTPPCAKCVRAASEASEAAAKFPGQVQVRKVDALGPETEELGLVITPTVLINGVVVASGRVLPEAQITALIATALEE